MRFRYPHAVTFPSKLSTMNTQALSNSTPFPNLIKPLFHTHHFFFNLKDLFSPFFCSKATSKYPPSPLKINGYHSTSIVKATGPVYLDESVLDANIDALKRKLEVIGMDAEICVPGYQYNHLLCPECQGGETGERTFAVIIAPDGGSAAWKCFRAKCGWKGSTQAFAGRNP